ncbi:MAG: hypothetical protein H6Q05_2547 [Acidobacteria bacterium]|nr:hypothetical protein [Acidobacteriota bacterium]
MASGAGRYSIFVDTSAWIAFFSARDQNHSAAERLFREATARNASLVTTNLVLAEIHRLILHRAGVEAAGHALNTIESSARVSIVFSTGAHHAAAKAWLVSLSQHKLTYTDAISFAVMKDARCDGLFSFDSDFLPPASAPGVLPEESPVLLNPPSGPQEMAPES